MPPAEQVLPLRCSRGAPLLVEVWEDRASAAAAPAWLSNRVFCPVVTAQVRASAL
jgi:hypothetical protein